MINKKKQVQGKIVEDIIRKKGIKITQVASDMCISRATLYKRFRSDKLTDVFLFNIGKVINVDFSEIFPELKNSIFYEKVEEKMARVPSRGAQQITEYNAKYANLLEEYNKLLKFLVELMDENEFYSIKRDISMFVKDHIKKNPLK